MIDGPPKDSQNFFRNSLLTCDVEFLWALVMVIWLIRGLNYRKKQQQ